MDTNGTIKPDIDYNTRDNDTLEAPMKEGDEPDKTFIDRFIENSQAPWATLPDDLRPPKWFDAVYRRILESERHAHTASSLDVLALRDPEGLQDGSPFIRHYFPRREDGGRASLILVHFQGAKPVPYQLPLIDGEPEYLDTPLTPGTPLYDDIGALLEHTPRGIRAAPIPIAMVPDKAPRSEEGSSSPLNQALLAAHAAQWLRTEAIAYKTLKAYARHFPSEKGRGLVEKQLESLLQPTDSPVCIMGYDGGSIGLVARPRRLQAEADLIYNRYYMDDQIRHELDIDRLKNPVRYGLAPNPKPPTPHEPIDQEHALGEYTPPEQTSMKQEAAPFTGTAAQKQKEATP